jgi:signal transduction histidine kinase
MVGDLGRRVPVRGSGDEFDRLAASMNAMLDRIEELMVGMRTVTDSIGHDLRSPLTRLRSRLERIQPSETSPTERDQALDDALGDIDATLDLLNRLLEIARAESGLQREQMTKIDVASVAVDVAELYDPTAEEAGLSIEATADQPVMLMGHGELLAQAVSNLVDNATKYARQHVRVEVSLADGSVTVSVVDDGPGIPEEDRERAIQRFVRLDPSRTGRGSGLGLSLVAAVARLHGGSLVLSDAEPGLRADMVMPISRG